MSLKMQEISSSTVDGAQTQAPPLARQYFLLQSDDEIPNHDVELGSVYEIYHRNLPPRTPTQLRSTRVVMVSEKTDLNVAIRYPSIGSLCNYFSNRITEMYPALDEKFVMGTKIAGKVLLRQVPSQEFSENKHLEEFWLVHPNSHAGPEDVDTEEDSGLARELKNNGMVTWGVRRQVMFIGRHREMSKSHSSSSTMQGEEEVKDQQAAVDNNEDEEEKDEEEIEVDQAEEKDDKETLEYNLKLKRKCDRNLRKRKNVKREDQLWQVSKKPKKKCNKLPPRDPTNRWSKERYMAAERSLLEVMKDKKAMIGNPIIRPALRVEARKRIGDTGLLDHLLKHVANKVAPGGTLRFRRWHNAVGTMEYWLENADLLKIRKEAGVNDPFWSPPPGWKPGDSPIQDPVVAKELNQLKEEISNIKSVMGEFVSKKQFEEDLSTFRREIEELSSKKKQDKSQVTAVPDDSVDSTLSQLIKFSNSLFLSQSEPENAAVSMEKYKEQMLAISNCLKKIEAWMHGELGKETPKMEAETKAGIEFITPTDDQFSAEMDSEKPKDMEKSKPAVVQLKDGGEEAGSVTEGKAAKIERLKSGFRICKPQGTFLWPNMVKNTTMAPDNMSQLVVRVEDLLVVPTPPSVNSSVTSAPPQLPYHHHSPASPVKPVPEKRAISVTVSTVSEDHQQSYEDGGNNYSSTISNSGSKTTALVNLDDNIPTNQLYAKPSTQKTVTTITTTTTTSAAIPSKSLPSWMMMSAKSGDQSEADGRNFPAGSKKNHKEIEEISKSLSSLASSSSLCLCNTGTPTWQALTSHSPTFDARSSLYD